MKFDRVCRTVDQDDLVYRNIGHTLKELGGDDNFRSRSPSEHLDYALEAALDAYIRRGSTSLEY